jgi:hypothetical protein
MQKIRAPGLLRVLCEFSANSAVKLFAAKFAEKLRRARGDSKGHNSLVIITSPPKEIV